MAINQEKVIRAIYDLIFDSFTTRPDLPGLSAAFQQPGFPPTNTMLTLVGAGLPINPSDVANQWSPTHLQGLMERSAWFANLVDVIPELDTIYSPTGRRVTEMYGLIVKATPPLLPVDPAQQTAYENAYNYLHVLKPKLNEEGDPIIENGAQVMELKDSPIFVAYQKALKAYTDALSEFNTKFVKVKLDTPEGQLLWALNGPAWMTPVQSAWDNLASAHKNQVENAQAVISQNQAFDIGKVFHDASLQFDNSKRGDPSNPGAEFHLTQASPSNWFSEDAADSFTKLTFEEHDLHTSSSSSFSSFNGGGGGWYQLWHVKAGGSGTWSHSDTHSDTTDLVISFRLGRVEILRSWMNQTIFSLPGWKMPNLHKGYLSKGIASPPVKKDGSNNPAGNDGKFALLPISFLVARDIQITANWSSEDSSKVDSATSGGATVSFGPFRVASAKYDGSKSNASFHSERNGNTLTVPGIQIIGWLSKILPLTPPEE